MRRTQSALAALTALAALSERLERWYGEKEAAIRFDIILQLYSHPTLPMPQQPALPPIPGSSQLPPGLYARSRAHLGDQGRLHKVSEADGRARLDAHDCWPVTVLGMERMLGVSRQTFCRWAVRIGIGLAPWSKAEALKLWAAIHQPAAADRSTQTT